MRALTRLMRQSGAGPDGRPGTRFPALGCACLSFVAAHAGAWVHLGDCLAVWTAADDAQRTAWDVQAIRWWDAS